MKLNTQIFFTFVGIYGLFVYIYITSIIENQSMMIVETRQDYLGTSP